ncbi:hypothetical protein [Candidatus Endoriftia persephonae]|jgi:hypothetical protein|uniref:Uncharacterized protein n=1 Tax=Candidatus Endoriftia persephonae TaxID=393765 RepID=A0A9J6ZUR2_9GAMM|nr:hypothetical protein [Candidatus Endoriftia persephone]USF86408.1 hypothetical protein L0Y14_09645 [Candidatus Endoriftia persephone]
MKLVFSKDEAHQIVVFNCFDGEKKEFSYVDMIKVLIQSQHLEEPEVSEGFSEAEVNSIKSMVSFINKEVSLIDQSNDAESS